MMPKISETFGQSFLTEPEVAEILGCSTSKVKRLRFGGELRYVGGRPVLISKADLDRYIAAREAAAAQAAGRAAKTAAFKQHSRGSEDPHAWAMNAVFKFRAPRSK